MRDKPAQCYESGCPLAVLCRHCQHRHENGPCTETEAGQSCACNRFESLGRGFVLGTGDPAKAKYAFVLEAPGREELSFKLQPVPGRSFFADAAEVQREVATRRRDYPDVPIEFLTKGAPVVGQSGAALFGWILPKAGIKRDENVYLDNTLRCLAPKNAQGAYYPTGTIKKQAEHCCRQWDRLGQYRPDTIVVGLHPAGILREITPLPLAVKDAEKVRDFTAAGRKVLALLGGKAAELFLGYAKNVSKWRGHYTSLSSNWYDYLVTRLSDALQGSKKGKARKKKVLSAKPLETDPETEALLAPTVIRKKRSRPRRKSTAKSTMAQEESRTVQPASPTVCQETSAGDGELSAESQASSS